jgi:uncharacterized OB-fold protein
LHCLFGNVNHPEASPAMSAAAPAQRAIDPSLFHWPAAAPVLLAAQCLHCNAMAFPANGSCMGCGSVEVKVVGLPRRGKLWAWTIQRFMPKTPYLSSETEQSFKPFGVGYVELPGALRIETRLTENDPARLRIGAEVELVFYTHRTEDNGTEIINYAFAPV